MTGELAAAGAYTLLAGRIRAYLQARGRPGDTSIRTETARELLTSLEYTMNLAPGPDPARSFENGLAILKGKERAAWDLLRLVRATAPEDVCFFEALGELETFLRGYEPALFAHFCPSPPDYGPLLPVPGNIKGIDYCLLFLDRLWLENQLLAAFTPEELDACWATSLDLGGLPENLAEKPLLHGLGSCLLSPGDLPLGAGELEKLEGEFSRPEALAQGLEVLCRGRGLPARVQEYFTGVLPGIAARAAGLAAANRGLGPLFY